MDFEKVLIFLGTFGGFFCLFYYLFPKDIDQIQSDWEKSRRNKKGLFLLLAPLTLGLGRWLEKFQAPKKYLNKIETLLNRIDYEEILKPSEFLAIQIILPALFIPLLLFCVLKIEMFATLKDPIKFCGLLPIIIGVGAFLPLLILNDQVRAVQKQISRELPFTLDMLTSAVQAGLDFNGGIRRLIQKSSKPSPLKRQLELMLKEINLGKTRAEAMRRMGDRVGLNEVKSVMSALIQADQLGTSLGAVLTNLADDLRTKRFQLAEKLALEAPVKMIFPLVLFIFPSVFIILMGPIAVQLIATTSN